MYFFIFVRKFKKKKKKTLKNNNVILFNEINRIRIRRRRKYSIKILAKMKKFFEKF
jgi:hypothetical protein